MRSFITGLTSPKKFFYLTGALMPWLTGLFILSIGYGLVGGLIFSPADYLQGDGFRIIYVHAPCAFLSIFIYAAMAAAAFVGTVWRIKLAFVMIRQSAPIGCGFTLLALLTGSIWGKPMWGTWWVWDARLTSELILLFLYMAIILFQSAVASKQSGERACAILVLVGFVDIPIIHYSVYWWNTLHQGETLKMFGTSTIDSSMLAPLFAMIFAFMVYYALILFLRMRYELVVLGKNSHWLQEIK
jgi:heme exporter protein C